MVAAPNAIPGPAPSRAPRRIHLPQVHRTLPPGPTRAARWRCGVLIGVHVLIVVHLVHWLITGRTLSPLVLSEAMRTLENGQLNPGFILFVVAILGTALCGRFLCGWACHMGAMQDLCAWALKKAGLRPHRFQSRLLAWAPLVFGFYMFIWPTIRRDAVVPLLRSAYPPALAWIGEWHEFPGFSPYLTTTHLWAGLPGVWVAIPFLLICGAATVYFLGARGFCRYACPYGGILKPFDRLAPARIVADLSRCDRCGLCTAACSTGVRVMEETWAFGKVTDTRCVKTLDCVSICPSNALSLGWGGPSLVKGPPMAALPRRGFDLSWRGELAAAGLFLGTFLTVRGLYGVIPMMMALGIAACVPLILWKGATVLRRANVRFGSWQLRRAGRLRPAGAVYLALALSLALLLVHSAVVRALQFAAGTIDDRVSVSRETVFSGAPIPADQRALAERALHLYRLAGPVRDGGLALASTPAADLRASWLTLIAGRPVEAERLMTRVIAREGPGDSFEADLARIAVLQHDPARAAAHLEPLVASHADLPQCRDLLVALYTGAGRIPEAIALDRDWLASHPADAGRRARFAGLLGQSGQTLLARDEFARAAADAPADGAIRQWYGVSLYVCGEVDAAVESILRAAELDPRLRDGSRRLAADILIESGRPAEARARGLIQ